MSRPGPPTHTVTKRNDTEVKLEQTEFVLPVFTQGVIRLGVFWKRVSPGESSVLGSIFSLPEHTVSLGHIDHSAISFHLITEMSI